MARVAFIVDELFEDSEFRVPFDRLQKAGHDPTVVGLEAGKKILGKRGKEKVTIEHAIEDVSADEFDALVIPGGYSPDHLRTSPAMVNLTRDMVEQGKPVAAVCHGPWMLAEADVLEGHTVTSWPSLKTDLINAGAQWVDREVVEDGNLITSRRPDDLPRFSDAILRHIAQAKSVASGAAAKPAPAGQPPAHR